MRYPYSRPDINEDDKSEVMSVLQSQFLTQGSVIGRLEDALKSLFAVKHAVVCNSGTAALHMAYHGLGLGPNDGLITSSITFLATANMARVCNAPVGFADVDPCTGNVTLETVREAVEQAPFNVRVIAVVHLGGRPCDIIAISEYAKSVGICVVEDACHAPLAEYTDGTGEEIFTVGSCSHSDVATLSFHAVKHIAAGEGGVLLTNCDKLAKHAAHFRSHGMVRDACEQKNRDSAGKPWYYEMQSMGYNYRMSEVSCALAINQVRRLGSNIRRRQELAALYYRHLSEIDLIKLPNLIKSEDGKHAWHLFSPKFDFEAMGKTREKVMLSLANKGVGSQVHYIPLYRQPYYQNIHLSNTLLGAENYYRKTLSLPMYHGLSDCDIEKISQIIGTVVNEPIG